jgi:hypothetical protein
MRFFYGLIMLLLASGTARAEVLALYLARVTSDAPLPIYAEADAPSSPIGFLPVNSYVDVVKLSPDRRWALVSPAYEPGWVEASGLETLPVSARNTATLPRVIPSEIACVGFEPPWDAHLSLHEGLTTYESPDGGLAYQGAEGASPTTIPFASITAGAGRSYDKFAFTAGPYTGVLTRQYCEDGATPKVSAWSLDLLVRRPGRGPVMLSTCCSALRP